MAECRNAADLQQGLDHKERGVADALVALAATALMTAWKLEPAPRSSTYLLKASVIPIGAVMHAYCSRKPSIASVMGRGSEKQGSDSCSQAGLEQCLTQL